MSRLTLPVQLSTFKFTLDTNRGPLRIGELFEDMFAQPDVSDEDAARLGAKAAGVLSFRYACGADVTILVSKNAGRYRIQASTLAALWLLAAELVRRLELAFGPGGSQASPAGGERGEGGGEGGGGGALLPAFAVQYGEPLPLADFFACVDEHFAARCELARANDALNDRSQQFRVVQKRLLSRFKEKNPSPLNQIDVVLKSTYESIIDTAAAIERLQAGLDAASRRLSCAVSLLLLLMRFRFQLSDEWRDLLRAHLSPDVRDNDDAGWEEITDAAMTYLLRTRLAKQAKETAPPPPALQRPRDTSKLKKHITIVCDRLAKRAGRAGRRT